MTRFSYNKLKHDAFNPGLFLFNGIIAVPVVLLTGAVMVWGDNIQLDYLGSE